MEFYINWKWRAGRENMVANALSRKQENLTTAREKILASRQGQLIKESDIYPSLETLDLLKMENPPEIRPSRLNTPWGLNGIKKGVTG